MKTKFIYLLCTFISLSKALSSEVLADLSKDADKLQRVLQYHLVSDVLSSSQFYDNKRLETLVDGARVTINEYSSV